MYVGYFSLQKLKPYKKKYRPI